MRKQWKLIYTRPTRVQDAEPPIVAPLLHRWPRLIRAGCYIPREGKWESWYPEREFMRVMEHLAARVKSSTWNFRRHLTHYHRVSRQIHTAARRLVREPSRATYQSYLHTWYPYANYIWTPWAITFVLEPWFTEELKKYFPDRWQELYESLAVPTTLNETTKLQRALLEWRLRRGAISELARLSRRFGYLAIYSVNDPPWTPDDLAVMARDLGDPRLTLRKMDHDLTIAKRRARAALHILAPWKTLHRVAETIHHYTWLRTDRIDTYKKTFELVRPFYRTLERQWRWPTGGSAHLTCREIDKALRGHIPATVEISRRVKHHYICYMTRTKTTVMSNPRVWRNFCNKHVPGWQPSTNAHFVRGASAYPGIVRGRARIILHLSQAKTMRTGEVLIANMTHPDYMSAIKKSVAMVTDEGGILCHASIVSRENKIPCVIGTCEATKVFRTGDIVEVDATQGIVRKLTTHK